MSKQAIKKCSINEFNTIIDSQDGKTFISDRTQGLKYNTVLLYSTITKAYIEYLNYNIEKGYTHKIYETDLNGLYPDGTLEECIPLSTNIAHIARSINRIHKFEDLHDKASAPLNGAGILLYNPKLSGTTQYVYEYDMHLAWLQAFGKCKLPDTSVLPQCGIVKAGQIGFNDDCCVFEGSFAKYIFPILDADFSEFVNKQMFKIDNLKGIKRKDAKLAFNAWLGNMQNHNCFIRLAVIFQCNDYVRRIWNKYKNICVYGVSDSIASIKRINELETSNLWSIKKEGYIYMVPGTSNRVWLNEEGFITEASYRGIPQEYLVGKHISEVEFKRDADLNKYYIDYENMEIRHAKN